MFSPLHALYVDISMSDVGIPLLKLYKYNRRVKFVADRHLVMDPTTSQFQVDTPSFELNRWSHFIIETPLLPYNSLYGPQVVEWLRECRGQKEYQDIVRVLEHQTNHPFKVIFPFQCDKVETMNISSSVYEFTKREFLRSLTQEPDKVCAFMVEVEKVLEDPSCELELAEGSTIIEITTLKNSDPRHTQRLQIAIEANRPITEHSVKQAGIVEGMIQVRGKEEIKIGQAFKAKVMKFLEDLEEKQEQPPANSFK
uniref:Uncharacterized protein n=1 Tax=Ditylenchus dipsaci TaxID=166011 RepID=A0A915DZX8_9BILA